MKSQAYKLVTQSRLQLIVYDIKALFISLFSGKNHGKIFGKNHCDMRD